MGSTSTNDAAKAKRDDLARIPEITGSLRCLFILRALGSLALVVAGLFCLYFGQQMLITILAAPAQTALLEISGTIKVTAGGFGAVVMTASLFAFLLAYWNRPSLAFVPGGGAHRLATGGPAPAWSCLLAVLGRRSSPAASTAATTAARGPR